MKVEKAVEAHSNQLLGILYGMEINIGDINMRVSIFIIENMIIDLILGRIWTRYIHVYFINKDDGIYIYIIKSSDDHRITRFITSSI
jgi:hypothetical protein